ncbi:TPA: hypothetical protein I8372_004793 [Citrobacter farmeri]|nr:hypothetical protein [Citrobacter farmeri]HAT2779615.1 hypothetical protein [Citrobacter farmeri]HAT2810578.1 hypothetical protein [Citrobacter farmeri]HBC0550391.1 hypothetical protein [Citrobacter farmeri]
MATQPTNQPVPSESSRDLKFNAGKIDEFVTSLYQQYIDRFGKSHYTIEGLKQLVLQQIYNLGWNLNGTFQGGGTVTSAGDLLQDETTNIWYRWDDIQTLPKNVPVGSTPETAGGVGDGKWQPVDVADVLRRDLANPDTGYGDSLIAVKAPFIGAIARTQHQKNADIVSLKDFAVGDGVSDEYTAIMSAYNWAASNGKSLFIPAGVYKFSQKLTFDKPEVSILGAGIKSSSLQFTGSGIAVEFNDSNPNHNQFAFTGGIYDVEIVGNSNSTILLYNKNVNHWCAERINLRESSTTAGVGLKIDGPTGCRLEHIVCSTNAQPMTSRPFVGIWLDAEPVTGSRTSCTTIIHPIVEGMFGDGIVLKGCDQSTFIGGTSENNNGNGVTIADSGQPRINTFIGMGFEANSGFADIYDAGQMNVFINCYTSKLAYFATSSLFSELRGGYHQKITTEGDFTSIRDLKISFFGTGGTVQSRENSVVERIYSVQTSAMVSFPKAGHVLTLGASPFMFTNTFGFPIDIMLSVDSAPTVTATWFCEGTTRNIKVDTTGGIRLNPGNSLDIVYTGTPTFYWMPR